MTNRDYIAPLPPDLEALLAGLPAEDHAALVEAWMLAGDAPEPDRARRATDWSVVQSRMVDRVGVRLVPRTLRLLTTRPVAVAATIVLLVGMLSIFGLADRRVDAPVGGMPVTETVLPDGSTVLLSPGSTVRYARSFGETTRQVRLEGEAYFDVVHDDIPFVVHTFNADVEVLGTAFNVRAWPDAGRLSTEIYLERGSVRVASPSTPDLDVRLAPGQTTSVDGEGVPAPPVAGDAEFALAWRNGGLAFRDAPIGDVLDEVERRYNVEIRAPEDVRLSRISYFKYTAAGPDEILSDVVDATGLRFRRMARGFEVYIP